MLIRVPKLFACLGDQGRYNLGMLWVTTLKWVPDLYYLDNILVTWETLSSGWFQMCPILFPYQLMYLWSWRLWWLAVAFRFLTLSYRPNSMSSNYRTAKIVMLTGMYVLINSMCPSEHNSMCPSKHFDSKLASHTQRTNILCAIEAHIWFQQFTSIFMLSETILLSKFWWFAMMNSPWWPSNL